MNMYIVDKDTTVNELKDLVRQFC